MALLPGSGIMEHSVGISQSISGIGAGMTRDDWHFYLFMSVSLAVCVFVFIMEFINNV